MGKAKQKILIYSPYLSVSGGGERYLFQIAGTLQKNHLVYLLADKTVRKKARETFSIDLQKVEFLPPLTFRLQNFFSRYFFLKQFDVCFYMTDGSLFYPAGIRNYLIIQSPAHIPPSSLTNGLKIRPWRIICYSSFMKKIIESKLHREALPLPPAVDISLFKKYPIKKEKIILSVGRFFSSPLHEKRQDFLLDFFIKNYKEYFRGWQLYLSGNLTEDSGRKLVERLQNKIKNYPVVVKVNLPFSELLAVYQKSSLYWHAAGFGSSPARQPEKMEHFGLTTLEAMAGGCVPLVFAAGGQTDIIKNKKNGFLWSDEDSFLKYNRQLINNPDLMEKIARNARNSSADYSLNNFKKRLNDLL